MTPVTIPDILNVITICQLRPVFVDLAEQTCNIDCDDLERRITSNSRVLLITHLCGFPSNMNRLLQIAEQHGLEIFEDCSQIMGGMVNGQSFGLLGRAGFFSLTTLKTLSTFQGGLVVTNDERLDARLREFAESLPRRSAISIYKLFVRDLILYTATNRWIYSKFTHHLVRKIESFAPKLIKKVQHGEIFGSRSLNKEAVVRKALAPQFFVQYTDAQAAIGLDALKNLRGSNQVRNNLGNKLLKALAKGPTSLGLPRVSPRDASGCTFWRFPYWIERGESFMKFLRARGIDTTRTNLLCLSEEPAFSEWASPTPNAVQFVNKMVFLPIHINQSDEDMTYIANSVAAWFKAEGD